MCTPPAAIQPHRDTGNPSQEVQQLSASIPVAIHIRLEFARRSSTGTLIYCCSLDMCMPLMSLLLISFSCLCPARTRLSQAFGNHLGVSCWLSCLQISSEVIWTSVTAEHRTLSNKVLNQLIVFGVHIMIPAGRPS